MADRHIVIVGSGHGGAQAAIALRQCGFGGAITIVGDDPEFPYERPPLSKDYLSGERPFDRLLMRPESFWAERRIGFRRGTRVTAVDAGAHCLSLKALGTDAPADLLSYDALIWAAGGAARRLICEGHDLAGVHTIRTRADVDQLRTEMEALKPDDPIVVVGGGYIGLEAAAVLVKSGGESARRPVTIVEAQSRLLARVAGPALSEFYAGAHRARSVELRFDAQVEALTGDGARVTGVRLADGTLLPARLVIVGIGITPSVEPLLSAGAEGGNGVRVNARCVTTLPDVYAIGDCALHRNDFADGAEIRLESVQNATDQAAVVARALTGDPVDYHAVPWFWSNQYDLKLQTVGLSHGHDDSVTRGDPASASFSVVYLREGRVIALDCVNATRDYVQGRALVLARARIDKTTLANADIPLKTMLTSEA